jgi:hypothetical protein
MTKGKCSAEDKSSPCGSKDPQLHYQGSKAEEHKSVKTSSPLDECRVLSYNFNKFSVKEEVQWQ